MGGVGLKVGIYGGGGYAGAELVRLLAGHPEVGTMGVSSRGYAGRGISEVYPQLAVEGEYIEPEGMDVSGLAVAFVAAFPINRWLIARGRGHAVVHEYHEGH